MSQITRRSVTRGAAWSVPAVAVAGAAPAFATSQGTGDFPVTCNTGVLSNSGTSTYSHVIATGGYSSLHTWNLGFIDVQQAPTEGATGFRLNLLGLRATAVSGNVYAGTYSAGFVTTAQAIPFGVSMGVSFRTNGPYSATCLDANEHIVKMEMDFCITWLRGLTPTSPASQQCCYTLTHAWNPNQAGIACPSSYRAASGSSLSKTLLPM